LNANRFLKLGLTGGIASGKSAVARVFAGFGCGVIDADRCARDVVAPGSEGLAAVRDEFGESVIAPDGSLDRESMRRIVFSDPAKRLALEAIVHPLVFIEIHNAMERFEMEGRPAGIIEAALLIENAKAFQLDAVISITAGTENRAARLRARDQWADKEIDGVLKAQMSDEERSWHSDYVINNNGTLDDLAAAVTDLWRHIQKEVNR
jgi:dephospho-CoA kinase